ncbi:hypothetical protein L914_15853 [Phytophthora nicotianae]|uniref:Uncharacterized protein n=2 Tax=Phytophthora nicotianae TaxID=4792 RepID=W2MMU6_PHYNI|nr:hypothetical protein L914_15853 [Phytophthora nicotianae]ETO66323.1 hypothetical protein F444_16456 [Phytophthora nicotianae P1976]
MVKLRAAGGGNWYKEDGWPWLRIKEQHSGESSSKSSLVLDKCLLRKGSWKELEVELQGHKRGIISFELWVGRSKATDFLQFVMGWNVDLAQWIQSGGAKRWYGIQASSQDTSSEVAKGPELCENETELQSSAAYICVDITDVEDPVVESSDLPQQDTTMEAKEAHPAQKSPFQFVIPRYSLVKSGKLRAVRIGKIVHELRIDTLYDLLPWTLYGHNTTRCHPRASANRSKYPNDEIAKALILLQLSCQYANYCVGELNRYSSKLEKRNLKLKRNINRIKERHKLLKKKKVNLQHEAEVLSCSLSGMQSLLEGLDPETLPRLHAEHRFEPGDD